MEEQIGNEKTSVPWTRSFVRYVYDNRYIIALLAGLIGLVHGSRMFSNNIGIDTESIIHDEEALYESWLRTGRYGLVFLKYLTGTEHFNPYFDGAVTLVFLLAACVGFGYLFYTVKEAGQNGRGERGLLLVLGAVMAVHPVLTEQLYFALQSKEITLGFVLLAVCLLLSHYWAEDKSILCLGTAAAIMVLAFSIYQAMVPLYVFGAAAVSVLRWNRELETGSIKKSFFYIVRLASAFLMGLMINQAFTYCLFGTSAYLTEQIRWQSEGILAGVLGSAEHIASVITVKGSFYSPAFSLLAMAVFAVSVLRIRQAGRGKAGLWYMLLLAGLLLSPFTMTFVLGGSPVIRAQLVLPFVTGFLAYLAGSMLITLCADTDNAMQRRVTRVLKTVLVILCTAIIWKEAEQSSRMYYTEAVRSEQDRALGESLKEKIEKVAGRNGYTGKVVFVGRREEELDAACAQGDVCGQSLFAWDYGVEPVNYWSSRRIIGYMHTLGNSYTLPDKQEVARAADVAGNMPCYPMEGSIVLKDNIVIVKLSAVPEK